MGMGYLHKKSLILTVCNMTDWQSFFISFAMLYIVEFKLHFAGGAYMHVEYRLYSPYAIHKRLLAHDDKSNSVLFSLAEV